MRRHAYPYGRFRIEGGDIGTIGPDLRDFMEKRGYPVIKFDMKNEGDGTLIISVNKKVLKLMAQKKPAGKLRSFLSKIPSNMASIRELIISEIDFSSPSLRELDLDSQRAGIELYLWPIEKGALLEIFILPYMERFNRPEISGLTQSKEEEITDWYLCEKLWAKIIPDLEARFELVTVSCRD